MQYEYSATQDSWLQKAMFAKDKKQYLSQWQHHYEKIDSSLNLNKFEFIPNSFNALENLPPLSFMLRVPFKLQKPYLSKDDPSFHLLDNPIRKDKVFQTPMVASTSWKGALHNAMLQQLVEWWCGLDEIAREERKHRKEFVAKRVSIGRLFGTEKGFTIDKKTEEDHKNKTYLDNLSGTRLANWYQQYVKRYLSSTGFFSGRLYFYPTFFDKIGLEVINPHDRKKGTGKNPILIESVPIDAKGNFVILYVPFGAIDESQVAKDLEMVTEGVKAMLTVYGFGAKTSSGFGIVEDKLDSQGELAIRADIPDLKTTPPEQQLEFLNKEGNLRQDFLNDEGILKTEKQYKKFLQNKNIQHHPKLYKEAKQWYEGNKQQIELNSKLMKKCYFYKLSDLCDRTKEIADHLCNGGQM